MFTTCIAILNKIDSRSNIEGLKPSFLMQDNQEFKKIIFTIDLDLEELLEFMRSPYSKTESGLEIFSILKAQELKEYFSENPQEFCKNVFNPEIAETCSDFKIHKATLNEYKEYETDLKKQEEWAMR